MSLPPVVSILLAIGVLFLLAYLRARELSLSRAKPQRSGHHAVVRLGIRFLLFAVAIVLIAQILGVSLLPLPLSPDLLTILSRAGMFVFIIGAVLLMWARESIGIHWAHAADFQIVPGQDLVTDGPYRFIRHPMYSGLLLIFLGAELFTASLLVVAVIPLGGFLWWQARQEERILEEAFGETYRAYRARTTMFLPWTW